MQITPGSGGAVSGVGAADAAVNPPSAQHTFDKREMAINLGISLGFDVGLSILIFQLAHDHGLSDTAAYLVASIGPVLGLIVEIVRHRRIDKVAIVVILLIALSAAVALIGSTDSKIVLFKDCALTGGIGLVVLLSLIPIVPRPLMFYMGQKFGTDGTAEGVQAWDALWQHPQFRHTQRMITGVWGAVFVFEAVTKAIAIQVLSFDAAYYVTQFWPLLVTFGAVAWTIVYARKAAMEGMARAAARAASGA